MEGEGVSSIDHLIIEYFSLGFKQTEIRAFLKSLHGYTIAARTLKRKLSKLRLYRRKCYSPINDVVRFIENELKISGQLHGYRWMHLRCLQNNLVVTQGIVGEIQRLLDPEDHDIRKRKRLRRRQYFNKGPDYLWHVDSYDKLKPYGLCIKGCIDGFSRYIIWLRIGPTSNDPKVIAGYFLDAIRQTGACPKTIRCDMGTENGQMEKIQRTLNELFNHDNGRRPCYMYGKSTHNQRIESWWGMLRKHCVQFWMNTFESLKEDDLFQGTTLDKMLIQFCFSQIVQNEMEKVVLEWNIHKISGLRNSISPSGSPTIMYEIPSLYGTISYSTPVPSFAIDELSSDCTFNNYPCDVNFLELCDILIQENDFCKSDNDPEVCIQLYKNLRICLREIFNIVQ